MISIIAPIYDPNDSLVPMGVLPEMLEKIRRLEGEKELILVSNSPKSLKLREYIKNSVSEESWCKGVFSTKNLGSARGFNAGLEVASEKSEIYIFMSADADIIDFKMLNKIQQAFEDHVNLGIVHPYSVFEDSNIYNVSRRLSYRTFLKGIKLGKKAFEMEPSEKELTNILLTLRPVGTIVRSPLKTFPLTFAAIAKKVILKVGSFDNQFLFTCGENNDLAFRALKAGFKVGRLGNTLVNHRRFTVRELTAKNESELQKLPHIGIAASQAADYWIEKYGRNYDEIYFEFCWGPFLSKVFYPYLLIKRIARNIKIKVAGI
jgi:GT2 family glycosyltransferase